MFSWKHAKGIAKVIKNYLAGNVSFKKQPASGVKCHFRRFLFGFKFVWSVFPAPENDLAQSRSLPGISTGRPYFPFCDQRLLQ